jgi:ribosomal protein S18 acetylase RimI-like enzyme
MPFAIRTAALHDHHDADRVARIAFSEYVPRYPDWIPILREGRPMAKLAAEGELIVAEMNGSIVGTVGYMPPGRSRDECFKREWSVLRMMAVDPAHRGHGIARALVDECVRRARRDGARALALYTSPAMETAVAMYVKAGFRHLGPLPPVIGMPADLYMLPLEAGIT